MGHISKCSAILPEMRIVYCLQVVHRYLDYLMKQGKAEEAAKLCPDLLKVGSGVQNAARYCHA